MNLADILAIKYNIDRYTIEQALILYKDLRWLTHEQRVKIIHDYLRKMGYVETVKT